MSAQQRINELGGWVYALQVAVLNDQSRAKPLARIAALALEWLEDERGIGDAL